MRILLKMVEQSSGATRSKSIKLNLGEGQGFVIGRTEGDLVVNDVGISRRHLQLMAKNSTLIAQDLDSRNGTFHQGKQIKKMLLAESDALRVGKHLFVFEQITREGTPKTEPRSQPKDSEPPRAKVTQDFPFLRGNVPDWNLALAFLKNAFGNWRTFWSSFSFGGVSIERSLTVLAAICFATGILRAICLAMKVPSGWTMTGFVAFALFTAMVTMAGAVGGAALFHLLRRFLLASGDFKSYLCYSVYVAALMFPMTPLTILPGSIAALVTFALSVWMLWGFVQAFQANLVRLIVVSAVSSIVIFAGTASMLVSLLGRH
jgi:hypothetical protein